METVQKKAEKGEELMPVYDAARNEMARRMSAQQGATPGGLTPNSGSPPPPPGMGGQLPPGAAPQSQLEPLLQQVMQILVQGRPEDLDAFGRFQAQLVDMVQSHQMGQQTPPMGGGGMPPQGGTPATPMR